MEADLKIAKRNSAVATRAYVVVNPLLAKHLPVQPSDSLKYFSQLGEKVAAACKGGRVLVVGFAETATAVGMAVASMIDNAVYVHTTRENMPPHKLVMQFTEDHSHAKNQELYLSDEYRDLSLFDILVFVEDEITTGKTILNFLGNLNWKGKLIVSALVFNGFDTHIFSEYDATCICLQELGSVNVLSFTDFPNSRLGVKPDLYKDACKNLSNYIIGAIDSKHLYDKDILVLGTEEYMYPALYLGETLESSAHSVKTHSTTRSPLLPKSDKDYPLKTMDSFESVYNNERTTYLYNLAKYDTVIIVTDGEGDCKELLQVIQSYGNSIIFVVRIHNA